MDRPRLSCHLPPGGSCQTLTTRDVQPLPTEKFKGAVEGKAKYTMRVQLAGQKRGAWVVAFVLPKKYWPFAETEILVGIPGMADTELSMTMQDGDFILHYNKLDLVQRVNQLGELVKDAREAPPVATITREQMRQDVGRNYVKGQTVHPKRENWHDKMGIMYSRSSLLSGMTGSRNFGPSYIMEYSLLPCP